MKGKGTAINGLMIYRPALLPDKKTPKLHYYSLKLASSLKTWYDFCKSY